MLGRTLDPAFLTHLQVSGCDKWRQLFLTVGLFHSIECLRIESYIKGGIIGLEEGFLLF